MSEQEEQPRPSLRLRKTPDRPPATPPEPPKPPEPKPAPEEKTGEAPRLRLSAMIRPGSGDAAAATPPTPPSPPPAPPAPPPAPPTPPAAPPTPPAPAAKAEPEKPPFSPFPEAASAPPPLAPAAATSEPPVSKPPPAIPPPPVAKSADQNLPVVEEPRALQFPQDEAPKEAPAPGPKAPSPRAVGLAIFGALILVVGGVAYLLFMDPLGLFKKSEPETPPAVATTPPAKPAPAEAKSAATTPAPAATTAQAPDAKAVAPAAADSEYKMPPPAPLQGGEEIAPGVVRLPRDASSVSSTPEKAPEPTPYEPPAPKANPAYTALVNNLNITGIRANDSGGFLMVNGALYRPGDIVDQQNKLVFVGIDGATITFKDPFGATYSRRF